MFARQARRALCAPTSGVHDAISAQRRALSASTSGGGGVRDSYGLWIDGEEVSALAGATIRVENPATRAHITTVAEGRAEDVVRAVESAQSAFDDGRWSKVAPRERSRILGRAAELLRGRLGAV